MKNEFKESTKLFADVFSEDISHVIKRLKYFKTKNEILKWLDNYEDDDYLIAMDILLKLTFYSEGDLYLECSEMISKLEKEVSKDKVMYFVPVEKYGKSATLLSYYFQKTPIFYQLVEQNRAKFLENQHDIKSTEFDEKSVLVFFDDFFGTGDSFNKHYTSFIKNAHSSYKKIEKTYGVCICYMESALANINELYPAIKIIGNIQYKIFGEDPLFFESNEQAIQYRNVMHEYANSKVLFKYKGEKQNLGYKDSQALIAFPYSPPNNTLPVVWSSKSNWYPIIPRDKSFIIDQTQKFRDELALLAINKHIGFKIIVENNDYPTKKRYIVFGLLRLLNKRKSIPSIAIILGISINNLEEYLLAAKKMNLIDDANLITKLGEDILDKLINIISEKKEKDEQNKTLLLKLSEYIPKEFSGK